jgi:hypothetical protein
MDGDQRHLLLRLSLLITVWRGVGWLPLSGWVGKRGSAVPRIGNLNHQRWPFSRALLGRRSLGCIACSRAGGCQQQPRRGCTHQKASPRPAPSPTSRHCQHARSSLHPAPPRQPHLMQAAVCAGLFPSIAHVTPVEVGKTGPALRPRGAPEGALHRLQRGHALGRRRAPPSLVREPWRLAV